MLTNLLIVLPIFALIFAGWTARKANWLGPNATREVNRLVVYLALPAMLFDIMANADPAEIWQPGLIIAFSAGCAIIFGLTALWRLSKGRHLADASIDALNASYANTGFIGFPLILSLVGEAGMGPALITTILTVCVLFAFAIICIEVGLQTETSPRRIFTKTFFSLARNPLLIAPVLGAIVMVLDIAIPAPIEKFLKLLGGAASPCALIALGLFLAGTSSSRVADRKATEGVLVGLKLIGQPLATFLIAGPLLQLPPITTHTAVLLSALPTGTGPFMLAEFYNREATLTGRVVLISTILSLLTISTYLAFAIQ